MPKPGEICHEPGKTVCIGPDLYICSREPGKYNVFRWYLQVKNAKRCKGEAPPPEEKPPPTPTPPPPKPPKEPWVPKAPTVAVNISAPKEVTFTIYEEIRYGKKWYRVEDRVKTVRIGFSYAVRFPEYLPSFVWKLRRVIVQCISERYWSKTYTSTTGSGFAEAQISLPSYMAEEEFKRRSREESVEIRVNADCEYYEFGMKTWSKVVTASKRVTIRLKFNVVPATGPAPPERKPDIELRGSLSPSSIPVTIEEIKPGYWHIHGVKKRITVNYSYSVRSDLSLAGDVRVCADGHCKTHSGRSGSGSISIDWVINDTYTKTDPRPRFEAGGVVALTATAPIWIDKPRGVKSTAAQQVNLRLGYDITYKPYEKPPEKPYTPPAVILTGDKTEGPYPLTVNFTILIRWGEPPYVVALWRDGALKKRWENVTATKLTFSDTIRGGGTYTYKVNVRDKRWNLASDTCSVYTYYPGTSTEPEAPVIVKFSAERFLVDASKIRAKFHVSWRKGKRPYTVVVDCGDGKRVSGRTSDTAIVLTHTYPGIGPYTATARVTDANGKTSEPRTTQVTVPSIRPPPGAPPPPKENYVRITLKRPAGGSLRANYWHAPTSFYILRGSILEIAATAGPGAFVDKIVVDGRVYRPPEKMVQSFSVKVRADRDLTIAAYFAAMVIPTPPAPPTYPAPPTRPPVTPPPTYPTPPTAPPTPGVEVGKVLLAAAVGGLVGAGAYYAYRSRAFEKAGKYAEKAKKYIASWLGFGGE